MNNIKKEQSFDKLDAQIINILQEDSRISARALAKKIGVATSTVIARIKKMEKQEIIKQYTIKMNYLALGYDLPVIVDVKVKKGKLFEVENEIARSRNVLAVYDITGEFDVAVLATFKTRKSLDKFVKKLQEIENVEQTNTKLILNTIKELTTIKF